MRVVLWDTRKLDVSKDFAGGYGVGQFPGGGGIGGRIIRHFYKRDYRPDGPGLRLSGGHLPQAGTQVEYCLERRARGRRPLRLQSLADHAALERQAMAEALAANPGCHVLVIGAVAHSMPEAFDGLDVTIVKGEAEQLLWKLDDVLTPPTRTVDVGKVDDLDQLPFPDWSPFAPQEVPHRLRLLAVSHRPDPAEPRLHAEVQLLPLHHPGELDPAALARDGGRRDPGRHRRLRLPLVQVPRSAVRPRPQAGLPPGRADRQAAARRSSSRSRAASTCCGPTCCRPCGASGLTSITVGIETPADETLKRYHRAPIRDDRQREFIALCRALGIRTVAGFMIGFPEDTEESILSVLRYAKAVNPTFANFNVVTPYPGTEFFEEIKSQIATFDTSKYTVYTPVLKYKHLTQRAGGRAARQVLLELLLPRTVVLDQWPGGLAVATKVRPEAAADPRHASPRARRTAEAAYRLAGY